HAWAEKRGQRFTRARHFGSVASQFIIAFYGGYLGAGIGILMLALLELMRLKNIHEMNGLKTLLASCINGIPVLTFLLARAIHWKEGLIMVTGAIIGGYVGPAIARRVPDATLRHFIILVGTAMTAYFFLRTLGA